MLKLRVGAGRFDSSAWDTAARDSRVASSHTTRETAAAAGRRHPAGLSRSPPQRLQIQVDSSICSASPPPQSFSSSAQPIHLLARSRGTEQAARAAAAAAAPSRRPPFSSPPATLTYDLCCRRRLLRRKVHLFR